MRFERLLTASLSRALLCRGAHDVRDPAVARHPRRNSFGLLLGLAVAQADALMAFEQKFDAVPFERAAQLLDDAIRARFFRILQTDHRPLCDPGLLGQLLLG